MFDFLQNLNPTASRFSSRAFIFIILQGLWNYYDFDLFVTTGFDLSFESAVVKTYAFPNVKLGE